MKGEEDRGGKRRGVEGIEEDTRADGVEKRSEGQKRGH